MSEYRMGVHRHRREAPPGTVGARVRVAREQMRMSQTELAEMSGVDRTTLSNLESGRHCDCLLDKAARLARALDVSLDYLGGNTAEFGKSPIEHE